MFAKCIQRDRGIKYGSSGMVGREKWYCESFAVEEWKKEREEARDDLK